MIKKVLATHGEAKLYAKEGGRTTHGTRPSAERLVEKVNAIDGMATVPATQRAEIAYSLQSWLVRHGVQSYFDRKRLEIEIDIDMPGPEIIREIIAAAAKRRVAGPVAQHLVGAKLSLRFPDSLIENHSFTTADAQLGRPGDFLLNDTMFHVTVSPMPAVIEKCGANIRNGYRVILLVTESKMAAARQMAEVEGNHDRIGISAIEQFVGQNIEELGGFGKTALAMNLKALLNSYNKRVEAAETDHSLMIDIPSNL